MQIVPMGSIAPHTYILCIIINYKNLQFEQFINDVTINFKFSKNFASMEDIRRKCNPKVDLKLQSIL